MLTCFCLAGQERNGNRDVGTGFYVRWRAQPWIATVAHNMTGTVDFDDIPNWPAIIHIAKPEGLYAVTVFQGPNRAHRFRTERYENGGLADMLLIQISAEEILAGHRVFDIESDMTVQPVIGSSVYHHGFPVDDFDTTMPPRIHESRVTAFTQHNLQFVTEATQGFSGGPVLDNCGRLLGFTVGSNDAIGIAGRTTALALALNR